MPLAQFTRQFWFPSGVLSANIPARVFPLNSNALATLYTDGTGTVQLPNPVTTDVNGTVTFWAEEGEYWIHIDDEVFRYSVGSPDVDLFEFAGNDMSTGVMSGGELSVNAGNPAAIDITAMTGYVVDTVGSPDNPVVTRVRTPAQTVALDGPGLARTLTWWLMTSAGAVIQQASKPTNTQRRTHIVLGATAQQAGVIFIDQTLPVILEQPMNQLVDLMDALGPFSIEGNTISPNGANLQINQSAGRVFARAFNHFSGAIPTRDPHVSTTQAQAPAQFRYITSTSTVFGLPVSAVDVANYDNAGVITLVGGGAGRSTVQRVWLFAANVGADQLIVQYGGTVYASLAAALDSIGQTGHTVNPLIPGNGALIAYLVVTHTATDLSDTAQARIILAGKFDTP